MGYAKWSSDAYEHLKGSYSRKSRADIFKHTRSRRISDAMDPYGLTFRESRDSEAHPNSLAIGVFLDVTGSMGRIPELLIRHKLGALMDTLIDHGVADPQVMFSAIGDHVCDKAPLQAGQFESGTKELNECLSDIFIESGGGGGATESYLLAWLVGGRHTSIDCFEKRDTKGFLFTVGDECSWESIDAGALKALMGYEETETLTARGLLAEAQRMYHVFHIHINETSYRDNPHVISYWRDLLGQNFLILDDHRGLAELIASTVALYQGAALETVTAGFDSSTAANVKRALARVSAGVTGRPESGVIRL
ncbi:MAG: hypothetical protein H6559_24080 [Lewinellaceae bacterium]|nr:hypothetical protein [Lewinellaceae bacterium]